MRGAETFVGRAAELAELSARITSASARRGSLTLIVGEPGIGKSRLIEELAASADATVLFGRCSEAGGAPSYWPWIQVLRALLRHDVPLEIFVRAGRAPLLTSILPELGERVGPTEPVTLEPERARFALFDAVIGALLDAAEVRPLCLLLEDLHAADAASLELLQLLCGAVRASRIAAIGTMREVEARRTRSAALLARVARQATTVPLTRLSRDEVAEYLAHALAAPPEPGLVDRVMEVSEGNALFVVQLAPRLARFASVAVPHSIRLAIRERLDELGESARSLLRSAAVIGREVPLAVLGAVHDAPLEPALDEALDAEVLVESGPGIVRFSHVLLLEELARASSEADRRALHRRAALALGEGDDVAWAQVAEHWLAADDAEQAAKACVRAARIAEARFAFDEAETFYARALEVIDPARTEERAELALARAHALLAGGDVERGKAACREVAELARALGSAELLARAALEHGSIFVLASIDTDLVDLLREALDALPTDDSPLRARCMARLAAALQPAPEPELPIAIARDAIAMARRIGDPATLLATTRAAVSAMMDLGDPRERAPLNREHVRLADLLGLPLEALRGSMRLVFDLYELGDGAGAAEAIRACERMARRLDDPGPRWRVTALSAMHAALDGRFAEAGRLEAEAVELGRRARDPNAGPSLLFSRLGRLRLAGALDEELRCGPELEALSTRRDGFVGVFARAVHASVLARAGQLPAAAVLLEHVRAHADTSGDLSFFDVLSEAASRVRDAALLATLRGRVEPLRERFASWGMFGLSVGPPGTAILARVAGAEGEVAAAQELYADAIARCEQAGLAVHAALLVAERGELEATRREPRPVQRELGATVSLEREGDVWRVSHGERQVRVKHAKGIELLARLVAERGRELHVLDLSGASGADRGDAGELLDERARAAYRERVRALRDAIEEASEWNDAAREARARVELEAIEDELARAVGLGGRARRAGGASERARVNVQRRLRDAIRRIGELDPVVGKHLERSIRTGTYCSYEP